MTVVASMPPVPFLLAYRMLPSRQRVVRGRTLAGRYISATRSWTFSHVRGLPPATSPAVRISKLIALHGGRIMSHKNTVRVVTRAADGTLRIRDYPSTEPLLEMHSQIGIDDCSTDLGLRGMPVFRGLIGPMPEGKNIVRYESPDVFETLTKEWSSAKNPRRRRRMQPPGAPNPIGEPLPPMNADLVGS